jgi:putative Mg2+ transporter-C (MgtC) family protein
MGNIEPLLQLILALVLGAALGVERTLAGKTAGMRTFALVSLGSALFSVVALQFASYYTAQTDPLRVASTIVSGIGFIGAGLIIFGGEKIRGLTTAAGLWVAAGIGTAVGFGFYLIAISAAALTLFVFTVLWLLENFLTTHRTRSLLEHDQDQ